MKCTEDGCDEGHQARGFCGKHYVWHKRRGTLGPRTYLAPDVPLADRLMARSRREGECLVWTGPRDKKGYGRISWQYKSLLVPRASFETWVRPLEEGEIVRHSCDNPPCFLPEHLLPGTHADNYRDAQERKRAAIGSRCGSAKMTEELVLQLRADRAGGASYKQLRETYGLSVGTISYIVNRKTWTHV